MANRYEFGRTNAVAIGNVVDSLKVNVSNIAAGGGSVSGLSIYYSPDDFTAVFAAATQLTIGAIANLPAAPDTTRFSKVTVTRADGTKVIYTADSNAMVYAAPTLTVTGAAFINTDLGYRVELVYQAKSVGIEGVAPSNYASVISGIDRSAANVTRRCDVDAAGALLVREATLDAAIGTHDAARPSTHYYIGARAYSGNPAPVTADNDASDILTTLLGQLRVYMDSALNRVNDEVKNEDIPPPEIVAGGVRTTDADITVNTPVQLTATSVTLKRGVWLRVSPKFGSNAMGGAHFTSTDNSIISAAGLPVAGRMFLRDEGEIFIPCDDPSKIFVASDTNSTIIVWSAV